MIKYVAVLNLMIALLHAGIFVAGMGPLHLTTTVLWLAAAGFAAMSAAEMVRHRFPPLDFENIRIMPR